MVKRIWYAYVMKNKKILFIGALIAACIAALGFHFSGGSSHPAATLAAGDLQAYLPYISKPESTPTLPPPPPTPADGWPMAGANLERTSWTSEEVKGSLHPVWYRPIEPLIPAKAQIIAAYGNLYISTARGLYVLDANTGAEKWVFPTELPLGNSPTIDKGIAYVGGLDHRLYAINAYTGDLLWSYLAGAGFDTNPLVVNGIVYIGNRDGALYAIHAQGADTGKLAWKFQAGGPIHFSAAFKDNTIYFAADDNYAYALNAQSGTQVWKSAKLPGNGFHSWWPVIYQNLVILAGSSGYRTLLPPDGIAWLSELDLAGIFPNPVPSGTLVGAKVSDGWVDASKVTKYFEENPAHRTYFVLNRSTGQEVTYDFNHNGAKEYAPILWFGTHAGNRFPPVVGSDQVLYQANAYMSQPYGFRGQVSGWRPGTPYINMPSANNLANDEPMAYSAGGTVIYYNLCCDRTAGAFDLSIPNPGHRDGSREWVYFEYNLDSLLPGYNQMYHSTDIDAVYGDSNGVYGEHGDQNPPIPYQGKVFMHRSNTIIAFGSGGGSPVALPKLPIRQVTKSQWVVDEAQLKQKLAAEVNKIIDAGHLQPGYGISGNFDRIGRRDCGNYLLDYWHEPSDIPYALLIAMPYLPSDTQQRAKTYLQSEFASYSPIDYVHIGWATGASREAFDLPPEVEAARSSMPALDWSDYPGWEFPPHLFYVLWKYAQLFGGAKTLFDQAQPRLQTPPSNDLLIRDPFVLNSYIAGYTGYLELQKLAGYSEDSAKRSTLNSLLSLRVNNFTINSPYGQQTCDPGTMSISCYCKTLSVSRNFMFLFPELGQYLHDHALSTIQTAVAEYNRVAPYWFVARYEQTYGEGDVQPLYDTVALFQAKAQILKEPRSELAKYLDVPAYPVGDLFYIQNLVSLLNAPAN